MYLLIVFKNGQTRKNCAIVIHINITKYTKKLVFMTEFYRIVFNDLF